MFEVYFEKREHVFTCNTCIERKTRDFLCTRKCIIKRHHACNEGI